VLSDNKNLPLLFSKIHTMTARYKKLSYCRETAQCTILINTCYVSQCMADRKVSNSKSDLKGHSRALAMVPFDRPQTISY